MEITRVNCPTSKYPTKCPDQTTMEGITVHNTANDASAMAEISYMLGNNQKVSYHAAVDNYRIVEGLPFDRSCYAAGDGRYGFGNAHTINIEICYSLSGGERFDQAEELAAEYIAYLLKLYGWGIEQVGTHQDRSGKYCPHRTLDYGWERFLDKIKSYLEPQPCLGDILDLDLYNNLYTDLQNAFKGNKDLLLKHLYEYGINEGRTFSYVYVPQNYRDKYEDLIKQYNTDWHGLLCHFLSYGIGEGRQGDKVFDVLYYKANQEPVIQAMSNLKVIQHFLNYGINEWRKTSPDFNVNVYKNAEMNGDLRKEFGDNCKKYYEHYIHYGYKENRKCN